jgi:hypothetical protein
VRRLSKTPNNLQKEVLDKVYSNFLNKQFYINENNEQQRTGIITSIKFDFLNQIWELEFDFFVGKEKHKFESLEQMKEMIQILDSE